MSSDYNIQRFENISKLQDFLRSSNVVFSGRSSLKVNPLIEEFHEGTPVPDTRLIAMEIELDNSGGRQFIVSNFMSPEMESFIFDESIVLQEFGPVSEARLASKEPMGALHYDKMLEPSVQATVEHSTLNRLLNDEESLRGALAMFDIDVKDELKGGAFTAAPSGQNKANRVVLGDQVYYAVPNEMDNYFRSDLVSEGALVSEPKLISKSTPNADKEAEQKAARKAAEVAQKNFRIRAEEESYRRDVKTRQGHISLIKGLQKLFGNRLEVPEIPEKGEAFSPIPSIGRMIKIAKSVEEYNSLTGKMPLIGLNTSGNLNSMLASYETAINQELFKEKNGFYIQAGYDMEQNEFYVRLVDRNDALLGEIVIDEEASAEEDLNVATDMDHINFSMETWKFNTDDGGALVKELGKELDDEGRFESLWSALSEITFIHEDLDHGPHVESVYTKSGDDVLAINDLSSDTIMDLISDDESLLNSIRSEVEAFEESLSSSSEYDDASGYSM